MPDFRLPNAALRLYARSARPCPGCRRSRRRRRGLLAVALRVVQPGAGGSDRDQRPLGSAALPVGVAGRSRPVVLSAEAGQPPERGADQPAEQREHDQAGADRQGEREPAWALLVRPVLVEAEHVVGGRGGDPVAEHAGHRGGRAHPVGRALVERADGQAGQVLGHAGPDLARGQQVPAAGRGRPQRRRAAGRGERPVRGERAVEQGTEPRTSSVTAARPSPTTWASLTSPVPVTTTWSGCTPPNATPAPCAAATPSATRATVPAADSASSAPSRSSAVNGVPVTHSLTTYARSPSSTASQTRASDGWATPLTACAWARKPSAAGPPGRTTVSVTGG